MDDAKREKIPPRWIRTIDTDFPDNPITDETRRTTVKCSQPHFGRYYTCEEYAQMKKRVLSTPP